MGNGTKNQQFRCSYQNRTDIRIAKGVGSRFRSSDRGSANELASSSFLLPFFFYRSSPAPFSCNSSQHCTPLPFIQLSPTHSPSSFRPSSRPFHPKPHLPDSPFQITYNADHHDTDDEVSSSTPTTKPSPF